VDSKPHWQLLGIDFSSAPGRRKPIWVAQGRLQSGKVQLQDLQPLHTLAEFESLLQRPGPWVGGFDLPLGLPRVFVDALGWGPTLAEAVAAMQSACADRAAWRTFIDRWRATRPAGERLPHRRCDTALPGGACSTSPLQTRYVPVALMLYEGLPRLLAAGLSLPGQHAGDAQRVALEAYPGWLAQQHLGRRSYKNRDDAERRAAREDLLSALAPRLGAPAELRQLMLDDVSGDPLDATLCLLQAASALEQPRWGQPAAVDPLEGWILGALDEPNDGQ
jgi:hypothetical protein